MDAKQEKGNLKSVVGLLVMDVDSTLINEEGIDLLGDLAGVGEQVAAITERAMRGELDFQQALEERVALLKGLPVSVFDQVAATITLTPGAQELISHLQSRGWKTGLVSGGFIQTVGPLAQALGIDRYQANELEVTKGYLTGSVVGDLVTKETKKEKLLQWAKEFGLSLEQTVAVGDGANDLLMIATAGKGVAFCAKPMVRDAAPYAIEERDLTQIIQIIEGEANDHL